MTNRNLLRTFTLAVALAILSVANMAVFANDSRTITVHQSVSLGGTQLSAGKYKVSWQTHSTEVAGQDKVGVGHRPEATVTFSKDDKIMATVEGKLVDRDATYNRDAVIYKTNPDGSRSISEIRFKNMKQVIVFGQ